MTMKNGEDLAMKFAIALSLKDSSSKMHCKSQLNPVGGSSATKDDYIIAKLLQEEGINDDVQASNSDADYKYALTLQENENKEGVSINHSNHSIQDSAEHFSNSIFNVPSNTCYNCRKPIGHEGFFSAMGVKYHSRCFLCDGCNLPINKGRFAPKLVPVVGSGRPGGSSAGVSSVHAVPYHPECIRELYTPVCGLCNDKLQGATPLPGYCISVEMCVIRLGKYYTHPFFRHQEVPGTSYCERHNGTQDSCVSCGRLEPLPEKRGVEGFVVFPDQRRSCPDCIGTAILSSDEARGIYMEVLQFMRDVLQLSLPHGEYTRICFVYVYVYICVYGMCRDGGDPGAGGGRGGAERAHTLPEHLRSRQHTPQPPRAGERGAK